MIRLILEIARILPFKLPNFIAKWILGKSTHTEWKSINNGIEETMTREWMQKIIDELEENMYKASEFDDISVY